jgi:hypothetical protein
MEVLKKLAAHEDERVNTAIDAISVALSQPRYLSSDLVYEMDHGLPSGNPLTSIMNSIFGLIAFRLCWLESTKFMYPTAEQSLRDFEKNVALVMYGDDNIMNITDWAVPFFNQHTMMANFPKFGLKYTSDEKDDLDPPKWRNIDQVTFLKRSFKPNAVLGRKVAPLDLLTTIEMSYFTKKGGSSRSITKDNIENTIRELSLHGKEVYEHYSNALKDAAMERMGHFVEVPPWHVQVARTSGYEPSWLTERM